MRRRKTDSDYKREVWNDYFGTITLKGVIKSGRTHVLAHCIKCGVTWVTSVVQLRQNNGCKYCNRLSLPHWKRYCKKIRRIQHGKIVPIDWWYSVYHGQRIRRVLVHCPRCGHNWVVTMTNLYRDRCPKCSHARTSNEERRTPKQFEQLVKKLYPHHEYSVLSPYVNAKTKVKMKHNKCGYVWNVLPNNFLDGTQCPRCQMKAIIRQGHERLYTTSEYKRKVNNVYPHHEYSVLSKYTGYANKIKLRHNKCHYIWWGVAGHFLGGGGCPRCNKVNKLRNQTYTTKIFKQRVRHLYPHHEYSVLSPYINATAKIKMRHNKCGYTWITLPDVFLQSCKYSRCPRCARRLLTLDRRHTTKWFKRQVNRMYPHHEYSVLSPYVNRRTKIKMRHERCKRVWWVIPSNFLNGCSCPYCSTSKGEHMVALYLRKHKIGYIHSYRLNVFKQYKRRPHLDFKLKHYRIGIEFDGGQHFRPVKYFGGKRAFRYQHEHDLNKDLYCSLLGITLIRIENVHDVESYRKLHRLVFRTLNHQLLPLIKKINKYNLIHN